jgi:putative nucleotidyltransferase with HDIG domain
MLFFEPVNEIRVVAYQKVAMIPAIMEELPPHHRIHSISSVAAEFNRILFEHPLTESTLNKGRQIIDSLITCVQENKTCITALGNLANHDEYTYHHSGRVAAYATAIAIQMSLTDRAILEELALGCLLHDVGKNKVSPTILAKPGPLTPSEWDSVRKHPQWGIECMKEANLDVVPTEVILHHHERADGRGYPHGLGRHELLDEVTIAAFSDLFDALTTTRPYQVTRTRYEALDFIRHHIIEQINKEAFKAMVEIFK